MPAPSPRIPPFFLGQRLTPSPFPPETVGVDLDRGSLSTLMPWKEVVHYNSGPKISLSRDLGYSLASIAFSWSATRGWRPGFWLRREGLSTCAHQKCSVCLQLSLTKQALAPQGHCALRSPVTLNRPSWHNVSWSLLSMSSFLTNSSPINNCFLTHSRHLYSREEWIQSDEEDPFFGSLVSEGQG